MRASGDGNRLVCATKDVQLKKLQLEYASEGVEMFKWLERKFSDVQRGDAQRFVDSLQGVDGAIIDVIAAQTLYWSNFYYRKNLDLYLMGSWIAGNTMFPVQTVSNIKVLQKQGTPTSTLGLQVWLHSSRALLHPELLIFGRAIWAELVKCTDEAEIIAYEMHIVAGLTMHRDDCRLVPPGLERLAR